MPATDTQKEVALNRQLTPRQYEVLCLMARGIDAKDIAAVLWVSVATVRGHMKDIYKTLEVHSRKQAVALVLQVKPVCPKCHRPL